MPIRQLIVVTLEGLATSPLGCYGSSWNTTPTINAIASIGCVWDQFIAPSDDPLQVIQCWMRDGDSAGLRTWNQRGQTELLTDDARLIELGVDQAFDQTSLIPVLEADIDDPPEEMAVTAFGQLVAAAIDRGSQDENWSLLWLHSRFLTKCWDAPRESVQEDEPPEIETPVSLPAFFRQTTPPTVAIDDSSDPDLVTSWMTTYGQQIRLVDDLIAVMLQSLGLNNAVVVIAGSSGFSLGQNGWIGHRVGPLRSCHTRLPLIIGCDGPLRWPPITSADTLPDLIGRLADTSRRIITPESWTQRDQEFDPSLITSGDGQSAVTTSRWFLVNEEDQRRRLFLKPDDVDDFNDISRLRTEVTQRLSREC